MSSLKLVKDIKLKYRLENCKWLPLTIAGIIQTLSIPIIISKNYPFKEQEIRSIQYCIVYLKDTSVEVPLLLQFSGHCLKYAFWTLPLILVFWTLLQICFLDTAWNMLSGHCLLYWFSGHCFKYVFWTLHEICFLDTAFYIGFLDTAFYIGFLDTASKMFSGHCLKYAFWTLLQICFLDTAFYIGFLDTASYMFSGHCFKYVFWALLQIIFWTMI